MLNILIFYAFLILPNINHKNFIIPTYISNWIYNSSLNQFILNFFSSIFFFYIYNLILTYTYSANFFVFNSYWNLNVNLSYLISSLYIIFLIKLGIGPWIFYKIDIYKNFNYLILTFYTVFYFLGIFIFMLNLFFIYKITLNFYIWVFIYILIFFGIFNMINLLFNSFNFFFFMSVSSLLNLVFLIIQWLSFIFIIF